MFEHSVQEAVLCPVDLPPQVNGRLLATILRHRQNGMEHWPVGNLHLPHCVGKYDAIL